MATAWAEQGRVIVRKPSDPNYGVELISPPAGAAVQARVVAFRGAQRVNVQRDKEVEVSWCADFQEMRKLIEAEGVVPTLVQAKAPGEIPVKVVPSAEHEPQGIRSTPTVPRARNTS